MLVISSAVAEAGPTTKPALSPRFTNTQSEHFLVLSDAGPARVTDLLTTAEATHSAVVSFAERLKLPTTKPPAKLIVFFFDDWGDYEDFAKTGGMAVSQAVPGFFDERANRCCVFNFGNADFIVRKRRELAVAKAQTGFASNADSKTKETKRQRDGRLQRIREIERQINQYLDAVKTTVVRHEIAHQVLFNLGIQRPEHRDRRWLKEGLAMQFETTAPSNPCRLSDFAGIDWATSHLSAAALVKDPTLIGPGAAQPQQAYAAAYALVYYLVQEQPAMFARYLASPAVTPSDAQTEAQAFESVFGKLSPEFENRWRRFVASK